MAMLARSGLLPFHEGLVPYLEASMASNSSRVCEHFKLRTKVRRPTANGPSNAPKQVGSGAAGEQNHREFERVQREPPVGIEPTTYGLRNRCSTAELQGQPKTIRVPNPCSGGFAGWQG
jgi:hypothetical protein